MQHPSESKHAKNSARLVKLIFPDTQILVGENEEDFDALKMQVSQSPHNYHLIYPGENSQPLEPNLQALLPAPNNKLIFIDATWRKALKMWHTNPWLSQCNQWHFNTPPTGRYQIRKTSVDGGLSTLEAVAYSLKTAYAQEDTALLKLFDAMQSHHLTRRAT